MAAAASSVLDAFNENDAASASPRSKKRAAPAAAAAAAAPRKRQKGSSDVSRARDATGASIARDAEGPLLQGFHFVASEDAQEGVLHEVQPLFVVLYDVDLVWIRMLECYQSLHPDRPVQARRPPHRAHCVACVNVLARSGARTGAVTASCNGCGAFRRTCLATTTRWRWPSSSRARAARSRPSCPLSRKRATWSCLSTRCAHWLFL